MGADLWAEQADLPSRFAVRHIASSPRSVEDKEVRPGADGAAPGLRLTSRATGAHTRPRFDARSRAPSRTRSVRPLRIRRDEKVDFRHVEQV
jgi:hypothetical protein